MRMPISVTKRAVFSPLSVIVASAVLLACGKDAPRTQLRAEVAPEPTSVVYFGAEFGSAQAALKFESAAQPQAF